MESDRKNALPSSRRWLLCTLALLGVLMARTEAWAEDRPAEDPRVQPKVFSDSIKAHRVAGDIAGLQDDVKQLVAFYDAHEAKQTRASTIKLIGTVCRSKKPIKEKLAVEAALRAIGKLGDIRGGMYIKSWLRQGNVKKVPTHLLLACKVAGELHCDSLADPLLKIFLNSKATAPIGAAMEALGHFGHSKRFRRKILTAMVESVMKNKPGSRPTDRGAVKTPKGSTGLPPGNFGGATDRWAALSAALPPVLEKLTGESFGSLENWHDVIKDHKGRLHSLFASKHAEPQDDGE
jgi:hypothetical protein